jgi:Tfp pilus assembly protein FimT
MKQFILITSLITGSLLGYSQEKPSDALKNDAKTQMVLRSNTRDQVYVLKDNSHNKQIQNRKQLVVNRQRMLNKKRMQHLQQQKHMQQQQRIIQQRSMQQKAVRQQGKRGQH